MRFERKYRIENQPVSVVQQMLRFHPAGFRKLFPDRQVNNIYYDTTELLTFHQNVYGQNERKKYRVRWYGSDLQQLTKPRLEIKSKHNELGAKKVIEMEDGQLENSRPRLPQSD